MLFRSLCFLLVCGGVLSEAQPEEPTECNPKACQKSDNQKMVCGSDGLTYPNRCQLERVRCKNKKVSMAKRGPCKKQRSCGEWQDFTLDYPEYQFKARCKKNGSYEPGQCHPESDYCWCVTPEGLPIPDTVKPKNTKGGNKPIRCGGGKKKITRSPNRLKPKNRLCRVPEKAQFNVNLLHTFKSEYLRDQKRDVSDKDLLEWKFNSLDTNGDRALDKREYRELKRLVAKAIKPKKCARGFPKTCDVNHVDGKITLEEWWDCLPRDGHTDLATDSPNKDSQDNENETGEDDDSPRSYDRVPPDGVLSHEVSVVFSSGTEDDNSDTRDSSITDEQSHSCAADKKLALEQASTNVVPDDAVYIPDCTPDDRFKKIQCYHSVGYCWCVNEDDGTTIEGTSVKGGKPNCDIPKLVRTPMKGCPEDKRIIFLQELMPFLQNKVKQNLNPKNPADYLSTIQNDPELSSFNFLDKNKNKMLDRSEWKLFKELVAQVKGLKKCGKKLPRYCDSNKDKQISLTEWRNCLSNPGKSPALSSKQRLGKTNPLNLLRDD